MMNLRVEIVKSYREYVLDTGLSPSDLVAFCKRYDLNENEVREQFSSLKQVPEMIWSDLFKQIVAKLEADEKYRESTVRERLLSFYREFFIEMKAYRSFAKLTMSSSLSNLQTTPRGMSQLKAAFGGWVGALLMHGVAVGEIADRSKLNETYDTILWLHFLFMFHFWKSDESPGFDRTNDALEKSGELIFDIIERNALDSALDFGKFVLVNSQS